MTKQRNRTQASSETPVFGDREPISEYCDHAADQTGRMWFLCNFSSCNVGFAEGLLDPIAAVKIHYRVTHLPMIYTS